MKTISGITKSLLVLSVFSTVGLTGIANAQTPKKHHSFLHRHRNLASGAAGVGAYKYAKHRKHGFMHHHPYLTGAAAAAATHHYAKKHR